MPQSTEPLVQLGFTSLEAEIYRFLLTESPVTGYRVAQALRKPAANIYKALESLEAKGAVMVDDGESRLCRATPPAELLANLDRRFQEQRQRAARVLSDQSGNDRDERVYQLRTPDLVLERCRALLERAREVVLIDAFPAPLEALGPDIETCAARGVAVAVKAYRPIRLAGARVIVSSHGASTLERWPGQWVNVVIDGSQHLVACLTADGRDVHQAIWSGSVYLSWVYHSAIASEMILDALQSQLERGATAQELRQTLDEMTRFKALNSVGYRILVQQLGGTLPTTVEERRDAS